MAGPLRLLRRGAWAPRLGGPDPGPGSCSLCRLGHAPARWSSEI